MKTPDEIKQGMKNCFKDKKCAGCPYLRASDCLNKCGCDALAYIRQLEDEKPRWINVEDRLPETKGYSLVVLKAKYPFEKPFATVARYNAGHWWYLNDETTDVTHWMPLPEPTEEGE